MSSSAQAVYCYVALGSNLGNSLAYLDNGISSLSSNAKVSEMKVSNFYKSKPHGPQDQPDYYNCVVGFYAELKPEELLDLLQSIEHKNEREREGVVRWGARTLDLDLLFYGTEKIDTKRLSVPHPRICERAFVLLPMRDLLVNSIVDLKLENQNTINDCIKLLSEASLSDIQKIERNENG